MRAWLILLLLAPIAAGQGHEHGEGSGFQVISDVGPDGLAYVGSPTHFELIAFGDDQIPDFHQNLPVRVTLDGELLYETTETSGHDYDGVHGFDIVFPRAGNWTVEIPGTPATLSGMAVEQSHKEVDVELLSNLVVDAPLDVFVYDADRELVPHVDHLIEYKSAGQTLLRTKIHTHDDGASFQARVFSADEATITSFTAAPEQGAPIVPTTTRWTPEFDPSMPDIVPAAALPPTDANAAIVQGTERQLIGTYDPFTVVGPDTLQHLQLMVVEGGFVQRHMSYDIEFRGPTGLIFASEDVHEHDGVFELSARMPPGLYELSARAHQGEWEVPISLPYLVVPSPTGLWAGPLQVSTTSTPDGATQTLASAITDAQGAAFAHGELEYTMTDDTGLVLLRDKLHTHGTGTFTATLPVPCGPAQLEIDAFPLNGAVVRTPGEAVATGDTTFQAAHDDCVPRWTQADFGNATVAPDAAGDEESPIASPLLAVALIGAILALRRRQP